MEISHQPELPPPPPFARLRREPSSCIVIGGGIVGLASARALLIERPGLRVEVLEKEAGPGLHQSTHNSGVLHAGLYYTPGSLKARLAVEGIRMMTEFCREKSIPHEICGKVVVATSPEEIPRLQNLLERGQRNGLKGLRWLRPEELREFEPNAAGVAALHVPEEGIVDFAAVIQALKDEVEKRGGTLHFHAKVCSIERTLGGWRVETTDGRHFRSDFVLNCAGLHGDRVARLAGEKPETRIVPFRGEYYTLRKEARHLVKNLIYPVPHPAFPFLGVHFTRLIDGRIEAGPNAVLALAREGYRKTDFDARDTAESLCTPGFWRFLVAHPTMCAAELVRSLSKKVFCESLQKLVPAVQPQDLEPGGAGVRAQAIAPDGKLVQDFAFAERPDALHVLNAPSPAATASLAIGREIARHILKLHPAT